MSKKKNQNNSDSFDKGIEGIGKIVDPIIDGLGNVVDEIVKNATEGLNASDLEDTRQIYRNIATVFKQKFQEDEPTCLSAVHILFNETDKRLTGKNPPTKKAHQLAESAKEYVIAIKVNYEKAEKSRNYKRTTEVFFKNPKDNKITVSRIQDEVSWDILNSDVRESSLKEEKNKMSYPIYPMKP